MATPSKKAHPTTWLKKVLYPFWIIQLCLEGFLVGWFASPLGLGFLTYSIIIISMSLTCFILTVTEIILYAKHNLKALTFLVFQIIKIATGFTLLALTFVANQIAVLNSTDEDDDPSYDDGQYYPMDEAALVLSGVMEAILLFTAFLAALIYASVIYHRHRRAKQRRVLTQHSHLPFQSTRPLPVASENEMSPYPPQRAHSSLGFPAEAAPAPSPPPHLPPVYEWKSEMDAQVKKDRVGEAGGGGRCELDGSWRAYRA